MSERGTASFELPPRRRRATLSLAPLIDVTFILLIFFMLVTQFERFAPVDVTLATDRTLPQTETQQAEGAVSRIILTIRPDGQLGIDEGEPFTLNQLDAVLARKTETAPVAQAGSPIVAIAPEPDVPLQLLLDVMTIVQDKPSLRAQLVVPDSPEEAPQ